MEELKKKYENGAEYLKRKNIRNHRESPNLDREENNSSKLRNKSNFTVEKQNEYYNSKG